MKISIIIPIYNVEKYLEECLESAVNQSLREIEIIAVNDGSTDGSLDIINTYREKYEFIKLINQKNRGQSSARNAGLKAASGEYIFFLDSDDIMEKNLAEYSYSLCKERKLDILTFDAENFFDKEYMGSVNEPYDRSRLLSSDESNGKQFFSNSVKRGAYRVPPWLYLFKRTFLLENDLWFRENIIFEDSLFTPMCLLKAEKIMYVPKIFYYRRIRNNSTITSERNITKNLQSQFTISKELYDFYRANKKFFGRETKQSFLYIIRDIFYIMFRQCDSIAANNMDKAKIRKIVTAKLASMKEIADFDLILLSEYPGIHNRILNFKKQIKQRLSIN